MKIDQCLSTYGKPATFPWVYSSLALRDYKVTDPCLMGFTNISMLFKEAKVLACCGRTGKHENN